MNRKLSLSKQGGATLVVGLIMLTVITLTVTAAFTLNNSNLKSVGNMQFHNEAIAATNRAIEQVFSSPFATSPTAQEINVDINNDGTNDYIVQINAPTCVGTTQIPTTSGPGEGCDSELGFNCTPTNYFYTLWDIDATVTDVSSGTSVRIHQGVRYTPTDQDQTTAICS